MMSSYTPGPYEIERTPDDDIEIWATLADDAQLVAVLQVEEYADLEGWDEYGCSKTMKANAYLIATAPEMVEWMKSVIRAFCEDEIGALDELDSKKVDELFNKGADILHRALTGEENTHGRQLENRW